MKCGPRPPRHEHCPGQKNGAKSGQSAWRLTLFTASLIFYAWGEPKFVVLLILSIIVNWFFGIIIDKKREYRKIAKLLIGIDILFNLSLFLFSNI